MAAELLVVKFLQVSDFRWVSPVVAELLVLKFLLVSDFWWGPPCGCCITGPEIFTSVRVLEFFKVSHFWWGPPCGCSIFGREIFKVFDPVATVRRSFLRQIATVRVHLIKYQSMIFSQGFQNCPQIWNWSTRDRVMALPAPFFSSAHFYAKSPPYEYIL